MLALFLDDNDDGDGKENGNETRMFILTNDNFARASRFVHFVHMYDLKLTNFTSPVYGLCEHSTISVTFFF